MYISLAFIDRINDSPPMLHKCFEPRSLYCDNGGLSIQHSLYRAYRTMTIIHAKYKCRIDIILMAF